MKKTFVANLGMHILELEITTRCNLNCKHCYNRNYKPIDLPLEKIEEFYKFADENHIKSFIISGGEAIMYPEFDKLVDFIKKNKRSFRLVLQTNGTQISPEKYNMLKNFDLIHISYDPIENVRLAGNKNLDLAVELKKHGIKSYLFCTIHNKNYTMIDQIIEDANKAKIDIGFNVCVPTDEYNTGNLLSHEEFYEVEKKLDKNYKEGKILRFTSPLISVLNPSRKGNGTKISGGCTAGIASCVVNPSGDVLPCPFFRIKVGNVFKESLEKIWFGSPILAELRNRKQLKEPCQSCEYLSYCGGCRHRGYRINKNFTDCDPMCYKEKLKPSGHHFRKTNSDGS